MLNIGYMTNIANANYCETIEMFSSGNGQSIREALIRQACSSCDMYATDILVLLNGHSMTTMFENENYEIDIYFRSGGVEWIDTDHKYYEDEGQIPSLYRKTMKLVKGGDWIALYEGHGNC